MKYFNVILAACISILSIDSALAQVLPSLDFAHGLGGPSGEAIPYAVATDSKSNICITGSFSGLVDFDPRLTSSQFVNSNGGSDIFIAKYDSSGVVKWVKSIGGSKLERGYSVAIDPHDNILVTGSFRGTGIDFDPAPSASLPLTSNGIEDIFVAKFSPDGTLRFAFNLGGPQSDFGKGIKSDANGSIIITGEQESDSVDYDPGAGVANSGISGGIGCFLAKYDSLGNHLWSGCITGVTQPGAIVSSALETDHLGNIYATGRFNAPYAADFDFSTNGAAIYSTGASGNNAFIFKYNSAGQYQWAFKLGTPTGNSGSAVGQGIAVDEFNNLVVTGYYTGTVDFDPATTSGILINTDINIADVFIAKYRSNSGQHVWSEGVGGSLDDRGHSIDTDNKGSIYVHGEFESATLDLDPGPNGTGHILQGSRDVFMAQYDSTGNHLRSLTMGGSDNEYAKSLVVDINQGVIVSGSFRSLTLNINPTPPATNILNLKGAEDMYLVRFADTCFIRDSISITSCGSYRSPSGKLFTTSGMYTDTLSKVSVCDSLIFINLSLTRIDTAITRNADTLIAADTGGTYQWFSCTTGLSFLNATSRTFKVPSNEVYACVISRNGCIDTTSCIVVDNLGIPSEDWFDLRYYPNPVKDNLFIDLGKVFEKGHISVFNNTGVLCYETDWQNKQNLKLSLNKLQPGLYFVRVNADESNSQYFKIIVE